MIWKRDHLRDRNRAPSTPDVLRGQFHVAAGEPPNLEVKSMSGWWAGVLTGVGLKPIAMMHEEYARTEKWPIAGQVLPVMISLSSPVKFKIIWDEVPTRKEKAMQCARALLLRLNGD